MRLGEDIPKRGVDLLRLAVLDLALGSAACEEPDHRDYGPESPEDTLALHILATPRCRAVEVASSPGARAGARYARALGVNIDDL
jgi:hypothetical protein